MLTNGKSHRQLEKISNKLSFLSKAGECDFNAEQKDWIKDQYVVFSQVFETVKNLNTENEYVERILEDLYKNIRKAKRRIISWRKFKQTNFETFQQIYKEKQQEWLPILDILAIPPKLESIKDEDLWDINFPCMSYTNEELCVFANKIIQEQNLLAEFNLTSEKINQVIIRICSEYNVPAYHNFSHGFDVFQFLYFIIKKSELDTALNKTEKFASLLGALGHDLDHRGYNNAYEAKLRTQNALAYFEKGILENMHASTLMSILKDPEIGFLDSFPDPSKKLQFKELATGVIIATDMTRHNKQVEDFTKGVAATIEYRRLQAVNEPIDKNLEEKAFVLERSQDRRKILKTVVHACDIGNTCQKYENYIYWAALITHEFDYQTKKEEKRGVDVTAFLKYKDVPTFYASQIPFTKNLALPLWEQISILFEGVKEAVQNLNANLKRLEEDKVKATQI